MVVVQQISRLAFYQSDAYQLDHAAAITDARIHEGFPDMAVEF